jgi:putative hydrolase of the HAD superfamily
MKLMKPSSLILFDMGNVLLSFDPKSIFESLCLQYSDSNHLISMFESDTWLALDAGMLSQEEALKLLKAHYPKHDHLCLEMLFMHWHHHMNEIEGMDLLIDVLKDKGHRVVLASNASSRYHDYLDEYPILAKMDALYYSCDLKQMKPSPEFFTTILEFEKIPPNLAYFIDDKIENCEVAQSLGIYSHHFRNNLSALKQALQEKGLL